MSFIERTDLLVVGFQAFVRDASLSPIGSRLANAGFDSQRLVQAGHQYRQFHFRLLGVKSRGMRVTVSSELSHNRAIPLCALSHESVIRCRASLCGIATPGTTCQGFLPPPSCYIEFV